MASPRPSNCSPARPVIHPRDVYHLTVLMNPGPSPNHRQTMAWFAAAGLEPTHISSCNTVPGVLANLVEAGIGISILPTVLIAPQVKAGTLVASQCQPALESANLCIVHRAEDILPSVNAALAAVRGSVARSGLLDVSDQT
ncbi:LysR substrate-binding domain-containing protein [Aurantimonas sp. A2-1-M11]|uniref:LysR substrate-binding domain-containing protein n=1 Tax=Aurantimonas sp. A2-1-M11 TaxID=3113712 RepID=UPI003FA55042